MAIGTRLFALFWSWTSFALMAGGYANAVAQESDTQRATHYTTVLFDSFGGSQDYRIEVHAGGAVVYQGRRNVATSGSKVMRISPEHVDALAKSLVESKVFDETPRLGYAPDNGLWQLNQTVAVYVGGKAYSLTFQESSNGKLYATVYRLFEKYAPTEPLRCPYTQPQFGTSPGGEICERRRAALEAMRP